MSLFSKREGSNLISRAIESKHDNLIIETAGLTQTTAVDHKNASNGVGTSSIIEFNVNADTKLKLEGEPAAINPITVSPKSIVIAHEFIHGADNAEGKNSRETVTAKDPDNKNITILNFPKQEIETRKRENTLREEQGLKKRAIPQIVE